MNTLVIHAYCRTVPLVSTYDSSRTVVQKSSMDHVAPVLYRQYDIRVLVTVHTWSIVMSYSDSHSQVCTGMHTSSVKKRGHALDTMSRMPMR